MRQATLYSILETVNPDWTGVYERLQLAEMRFTSMRKAIAALRESPPDAVVAEFLYGYGNNYAGVNISNLDVFLYSLQKYAPRARVVVLADKSERSFVDKLNEIFPLYAVLVHPATEEQIEPLLAAPFGNDHPGAER